MKSTKLLSLLSLATLFTLAQLGTWTILSTPSFAAKKSKSSRQKVMDFDGDLVEGMNKRPWDSLSQINNKNKNRKSHLYQKRTSFRQETRQTLQEVRHVR